MRYTAEMKLNNPPQEYARLWKALDEIGLPYTKMYNLNPDTADGRERWWIAAMVQGNGAIEFKENYYLNGNGFTRRSREVKQRLLDYCTEYDIPVLLVSRKKTSIEMRIAIQKWIDKLNKAI